MDQYGGVTLDKQFSFQIDIKAILYMRFKHIFSGINWIIQTHSI